MTPQEARGISDALGRVLGGLKAIPGPKLNPRWQAVVHLRKEGKTFREIGEALGFTTARAQQIWVQATRKYAKRAADAVVPMNRRDVGPEEFRRFWLKYRERGQEARRLRGWGEHCRSLVTDPGRRVAAKLLQSRLPYWCQR